MVHQYDPDERETPLQKKYKQVLKNIDTRESSSDELYQQTLELIKKKDEEKKYSLKYGTIVLHLRVNSRNRK